MSDPIIYKTPLTAQQRTDWLDSSPDTPRTNRARLHPRDLLLEACALERENAALRKAVAYYADPANWKPDPVGGGRRVLYDDNGRRAREALEGHSAGGETDPLDPFERIRAIATSNPDPYQGLRRIVEIATEAMQPLIKQALLDAPGRRTEGEYATMGRPAGWHWLEDVRMWERDENRALPCKGCNGRGYRDMGLEATGVECSECEGSGEEFREDSAK